MPPAELPVISDDTDSANSFRWSSNDIDNGIGLALSGGGYRALLFHSGALIRLNELGLLSQTKRIAGVSGGSLAAGILAMQWGEYGPPRGDGVIPGFKDKFLQSVLEFTRNKLDVVDIATGLLPFTSAAEQIEKSYRRLLFGDLTLAELPSSPQFVFCATNLSTGVLWRFTKAYAGDYVVGFIADPTFALAKAVAASAAFPPFLSPVILEPPAGSFQNWAEMPETKPEVLEELRAKIILCDGGVYDNHGVEPIAKRFAINFVSDGGAQFERAPSTHVDWISQLRRIVDVEDNQVRALRRRSLMASFNKADAFKASGSIPSESLQEGARFGAYWGIDTIAKSEPPAGTLHLEPEEIRRLASISTRLSSLGDADSRALVNWGYAIADRCIRKHYAGPPTPDGPASAWPLP
jgi:NTE family protein